MQKTGRKLKHMIESAGYTPRTIQDYLHLSCVQPIYRWYKGKILPSVDNLFMLSELLNVHMEDLLVKKNSVLVIYDIEQCYAADCRETIYGILQENIFASDLLMEICGGINCILLDWTGNTYVGRKKSP